MAPACQVERGFARLFFAFDVGHAIDLDAAEAALTSAAPSRETLSRHRRTPASLQFRPAPVQVVQQRASQPLCEDSPWRTQAAVECTLFDFGAISVAYAMVLDDTPLEALVDLAAAAYESPTLVAQARATVDTLLTDIGAAVNRPYVSSVVEDYVVYELRALHHADGASGSAALVRHVSVLARILRAADEPLSRDESDDALTCVAAYGENDAVWVDWNAAMVLDAAAADTLSVLEFANVQLLEMRFLDDRLDGVFDRSYHLVDTGHSGWARSGRRERRRLAQFQIDTVMLFEGVNNAVKLVGDQFLARVHRLAARRFHLTEWAASIERKLDALQRLYEKIADQQATRRMEVMELIIIVLIFVSIVLPFLGIGK